MSTTPWEHEDIVYPELTSGGSSRARESIPGHTWVTKQGFPGHAWRTDDGYLCGYVDFLPNPPYSEHFDYDAVLEELVDTLPRGFALDGRTDGWEREITFYSKVDGVWRIGFDCGDTCDYRPYKFYNLVGPECYRTIEYVKLYVQALADLLVKHVAQHQEGL